MPTRRGFLGIVGAVAAVFGSGARLAAKHFRPESQIKLFDYHGSNLRRAERTTGMLPAAAAVALMKEESRQIGDCFYQYKVYGPYDEPAWLTRGINEGLKDAETQDTRRRDR